MTVESVRIADTHGIQAMNRGAVAHERNRALSDDAIEKLDPTGSHILVFSVTHDHIAGSAVESHLRTQWMLKFKDEADPVTGFIDVSWEDFHRYTYDYRTPDNIRTKRPKEQSQ